MKWSTLCAKIGIPANVSFEGTYPRDAWVFDSRLLEALESIQNLHDRMNDAFCILEDSDEDL